MTEPLQVGQFAIVDHEPVDRGPNIGIFRGKGASDERPELYLLAEGTTPAAESFAAHVVSAAGQAWVALDISLTGSLLRVFAEAEHNLREWNARSIAQHRVSLGMGAVVRRGTQVILAQAGPTWAFHFRDGTVRVYTAEGSHAAAMAEESQPVAPQLRGLTMESGDRLLLISSSALAFADESLIAGVLTLPEDRVLADLFRRIREARNASVLLLSMPGPAGQRSEPVNAAPGTETPTAGDDEYVIGAETAPVFGSAGQDAPVYQPSLFIAPAGNHSPAPLRPDQHLQPQAMERRLPQFSEAVTPLRRVAGDEAFVRRTVESTERAAASVAEGAGLGMTVNRPMSPMRSFGDGPSVTSSSSSRRTPGGGSFSRGLVRREEPPRPDRATYDVPLVDQMAEEVRHQTSLVAPEGAQIARESNATVASGGALVRMRSEMKVRRRGRGSLDSGRSPLAAAGHRQSWAVVAGVLLVLLGVAAWVVLPGRFGTSPEDRYVQLVDDANRLVATARVQQDPAAKRVSLTEAKAMLLEARDLPGSNTDVERLLEDVTNVLTQMDAVVAPSTVEFVASLEQFGDQPVAITRMAVGDSHIYLLDGAAGQVIEVAQNGSDRKSVFAEDTEKSQGRAISIATFEPGDGTSVLLIADAGRRLWQYTSASGPRPVALAAPNGLAITDIAVRGRDLYILDAAQNSILRFSYAEAGFGSPPVRVLTTGDLADARYLMVDTDIITTDNDGTLRRFSGQVALELSQAGVDRPLAGAEPPNSIGAAGEIAIIDSSGDRVLVFRRDGTFDRQYRHKDFSQATALVTSRTGSYVFSGGQLRRVIW